MAKRFLRTRRLARQQGIEFHDGVPAGVDDPLNGVVSKRESAATEKAVEMSAVPEKAAEMSAAPKGAFEKTVSRRRNTKKKV